MKRLLFLTLLALAVSAWGGDIRVIVQNCKPAVLQIHTFDKDGNLLGAATGFFVTADGYLVTNAHVVDGASSILARDWKGTIYHVFSRDKWIQFKSATPANPDVILLRANAANVPFLTLGPTGNAVEGQRVLLIGNPENLGFTVSDGIIAAFRENRAFIQITAPISPGSSGSPVIDIDTGLVLGIAVGFWKEGQNLNFAIPTEKIQEVIAKTGFISQTPPPVAEATPTPPKAFITPPPGKRMNPNFRYNYFDCRAWALRGDAHLKQQQYNEAIRDYTEAIQRCPGNDYYYECRSKAYRMLGDNMRAAQDLEKSKEERGGQRKTWNNTGDPNFHK